MAVQAALVDGDLRLGGAYYLDVLRRLHLAFEPRTYFEIGTLAGDTLRMARCPSIAVDPAFKVTDAVLTENRGARLFEMTSDAFFAGHRPVKALGRPVDLAFLDGMHQFDFLLRDFINTEKNCAPGSIIVMHDCLPGDAFMTRPVARAGESGPTNFPNYWTGDVWKIVPVLRAVRPDLRVTVLDSQPTGLVIVQGLRPGNRLLEQQMEDLVRRWNAVELAEYGLSQLLTITNPVSADDWVTRVRSVRLSTRIKRKARSAILRARLLAAGKPQPRLASRI